MATRPDRTRSAPDRAARSRALPAPRPAGQHGRQTQQARQAQAARPTGQAEPRSSGRREVRARLLLLLGTLAAGIGLGLLLTGALVPGLATIAVSLLLCGGGFALGVYPTTALSRRMRQAPAVGLIAVGLVSVVLGFSWGAVLSVVLGILVLVADAALARRAAGESLSLSLPSPRSLVPRARRPEAGRDEADQADQADYAEPGDQAYQADEAHEPLDEVDGEESYDSYDVSAEESRDARDDEEIDQTVSVTPLREAGRDAQPAEGGRGRPRARSAS